MAGNFPDGMTASDWKHIDGEPECSVCKGLRVTVDRQWEVCGVLQTQLIPCPHCGGSGVEPEPDAREAEEMRAEFNGRGGRI